MTIHLIAKKQPAENPPPSNANTNPTPPPVNPPQNSQRGPIPQNIQLPPFGNMLGIFGGLNQ